MKFIFIALLILRLCLKAQNLEAEPEFTNSLITETSPYLIQHAHNPVDWYAWNEKTLYKAKKEHKPIFLSIGYSTCHWCHVMAHESFEDKQIAQLINKDFIAIKVDREELPHVDKYYQKVYTLLKKRSGGWPLTAILSEDAKVFYVGTYIPPTQKYNLEGLKTLLPRIAKAYKDNRSEVFKKADKIAQAMQKQQTQVFESVKIEMDIAHELFKHLEKGYDNIYYGFSIQPKFPEASKIQLLLDLDALNIKAAKTMALEVLRAMALGGIYDQVEGGFFRYSVDPAWEIPHFEKMLYTTAELIPLYVQAYTMTNDSLYKKVVIESIDMMDAKFLTADKLYLSASDADSEHQEGGYFIYTYEELLRAMKDLDEKDKEELSETLELSDIGNFSEEESPETYTHINFYADKRPESFEKIRHKLIKIREKRRYPFIDKKINTAWNAMMIEALFSASKIDKRYMGLAKERMEALVNKMYIKGTLYHQSLSTVVPVQKALLEDYAFLIGACLKAYEISYQKKYLGLAQILSDDVLKRFYDGKFWYLSDDDFKVYADMQDKYYKAAVNKMLLSLLELASLSGERKYFEPVQKTLEFKSARLKKSLSSYASAMQVLLREKRKIITIKASKAKLVKHDKKIKSIKYPFILTKVDNDVKGFLACDMFQCFSVEEELDKLIKDIERR